MRIFGSLLLLLAVLCTASTGLAICDYYDCADCVADPQCGWCTAWWIDTGCFQLGEWLGSTCSDPCASNGQSCDTCTGNTNACGNSCLWNQPSAQCASSGTYTPCCHGQTDLCPSGSGCQWCPDSGTCMYPTEQCPAACSTYDNQWSCGAADCSWCDQTNSCVASGNCCKDIIYEAECTENSACQWCSYWSTCTFADEKCPAPCSAYLNSFSCEGVAECSWCDTTESCLGPSDAACPTCGSTVNSDVCQSYAGCRWCEIGTECLPQSDTCPTCNDFLPNECPFLCYLCSSTEGCVASAIDCPSCNTVEYSKCPRGCYSCDLTDECLDNDSQCFCTLTTQAVGHVTGVGELHFATYCGGFVVVVLMFWGCVFVEWRGRANRLPKPAGTVDMNDVGVLLYKVKPARFRKPVDNAKYAGFAAAVTTWQWWRRFIVIQSGLVRPDGQLYDLVSYVVTNNSVLSLFFDGRNVCVKRRNWCCCCCAQRPRYLPRKMHVWAIFLSSLVLSWGAAMTFSTVTQLMHQCGSLPLTPAANAVTKSSFLVTILTAILLTPLEWLITKLLTQSQSFQSTLLDVFMCAVVLGGASVTAAVGYKQVLATPDAPAEFMNATWHTISLHCGKALVQYFVMYCLARLLYKRGVDPTPLPTIQYLADLKRLTKGNCHACQKALYIFPVQKNNLVVCTCNSVTPATEFEGEKFCQECGEAMEQCWCAHSHNAPFAGRDMAMPLLAAQPDGAPVVVDDADEQPMLAIPVYSDTVGDGVAQH